MAFALLMRLFRRPQVPVALTLSGNEITDTTRTTGTEGDGRTAPDSSMGIWPAATNLITNGGFETNTTGWGTSWAAAIARSTVAAKFGTASLLVTPSGVTTDEGGVTSPLMTVTAGATYTLSAWIKGTAGRVVRLAINEYTAASAYIRTDYSTSLTLDGTWQRHTVTATMHATTGKAAAAAITAEITTTPFYVDGIQLEASPVATPYVHTDGGTATRSAARVQAPASLLDETQGWVALRMRTGLPAASGGLSFGYPRYLSWNDGTTNNRIEMGAGYSGGNIYLWGNRYSGGAGAEVSNLTLTDWASGGTVTLIIRWTATTIAISYNGGAFTSIANGNIPSGLTTTFDIGSAAAFGGLQIYGDVLWFACGTGTLTDGDAAALHNLGASADPAPNWVLPAAQLTGIWTAANGWLTRYRL